MQIIIPMSGFGERFRRVGYPMPKPLIPIDGKPIIAHVVDMYPGDNDFIFVCNRDHLAEPSYRMAEILRSIAPKGQIVAIDPHKLGPGHAVLQARSYIKPDQPIVVNYCDFTCYWDWEDFKRFVVETDSDGCVPAYRGFHPHSMGPTFYAYMREKDQWMLEIQEKKPFTDDRLNEYASSGTYYYKTGQLCLDSIEELMRRQDTINGEYFVSLPMNLLVEKGMKVSIFELQHFMQWGTPEDVKEYEGWSRAFSRLAADDGRRARQGGAILLPMAGLGKRFSDEGYDLPKPLLPVSGRPMVIQAVRDLPDAPVQKFVLRKDLPGVDAIEKKLRATFAGAQFHTLDKLSEGQAVTCAAGLEGLNLNEPLTIGACDNGVLYDVDAFGKAMEPGGADVLVWIDRGHADGEHRPTMWGWVDADDDGKVTAVRCKSAPPDPKTAPMIIGAFTFRRAEMFKAAYESLIARDCRVNNEFYVDSLIEDCVTAGLDVRIFEIDAYIGWGTPKDLKTFEYWQSCFHKWKSHPYRLQKDKRIPEASLPELEARYAAKKAPRPPGVAVKAPARSSGDDDGLKRTLGEVMRFLPVGGVAVLIDLVVYNALVALHLEPSPAKVSSFIAGAVWAFFANRHFTFRRGRGGPGDLVKFAGVYLFSLVLNVVVNAAVLSATSAALGALSLQFAWLIATGVSTCSNFIGMKMFVFSGPARA